VPDEPEILSPSDMVNKLSVALVQISRGDPLVALRNELDMRFDAVETRFEAMDKATDLQHQDMVRVPTLLQQAIGGLRELLHQEIETKSSNIQGELNTIRAEMLEKFLGVAAQFNERDTRTDQRAGDTKLAVDAAFAAAKEATAKIEAGFTKQIDAMIAIIDTKTANLAGSISDIKDRLTAMESRAGTIMAGSRDNRDNLGLFVAVIAVIVAVAAIFFGVHH
jgi:hypothetical protein